MARRRIQFAALFAVAVVLLSGCSSMSAQTNPIDPSNGIWDRYFVHPLSWLLNWFADLLWGQYGLSILVVTIIIRFLVLPLTLKQYRSSKAMQAIQPEMKKIKDKYKEDPKKQQEETMKLFQKNGVNPLAGCLPLLVQMPILIALYNAIVRNGEISQHTFLWMQLGTPDPYYVLPTLAAITTFLQQKVMASQTTPQMQNLMLIFPVLIFVMSMNFASALPLYWVYSNLFTVVQSYLLYGRSNQKGGLSK
ncbi:membrane protein insertase YidC [Paenibacillus ginsengarvi]|uniref:Membrane protein insertase YidC n=1 Tax=Paenibacillus ginsengarvi TaxID=400777 RepID=A0A3B0CTE4_9BACL|nr:membrane protein insertase YidC [Paenibacillus ginsengarvi]RKN86006.1 membrane protein insertase YidC [Paenibacillus ginsengarvi]